MTSEAERPPNVLLILTDDQGWDDLGHHGNPYLETPHLDALARESVQFGNFYVASVCAPSRASLLTGRHFLRTGVSHVHGGKDFVHRDEVMLGELFGRAGYATGMWGKWHSGKTTGYLPWERGFDEAYMARLYKHRDSVGYLNGRRRSHTGWTVDTLTDYCLSFLERHRERPFLAFLPYLTVHAPLAAPEERIAKYQAKGLSRNLSLVYAMVEQLDDNVGRLLAGLDALGLAENTIVLFLSDNGPAVLDNLLTDEDRATRCVSGYKGHKGNLWENGIKSPLFVRWRGRFEPHTVTGVCDLCDLLPTLCELCGVERPADLPALDGRSIAPYLRGEEGALAPKESYLWVNTGWPPDPKRPYSILGRDDEYAPVAPEAKASLAADEQLAGVRTEDWKLLCNPGRVPGMPETVAGQVLVHIREDPREDRNAVGDQAALADELRRKVLDWFEALKREPHAFHMPVFTIGPATPQTFVPAYAPVATRGNVRNTGLHIANWTAPGDGADYLLRVEQPGRYELHLDYEKRPGRSLTLAVRAGDCRIEAALEANDGQTLGLLDLPRGDCLLSLDVVAADPSEEPIIPRMSIMVFRRMGEDVSADAQ